MSKKRDESDEGSETNFVAAMFKTIEYEKGINKVDVVNIVGGVLAKPKYVIAHKENICLLYITKEDIKCLRAKKAVFYVKKYNGIKYTDDHVLAFTKMNGIKLSDVDLCSTEEPEAKALLYYMKNY